MKVKSRCLAAGSADPFSNESVPGAWIRSRTLKMPSEFIEKKRLPFPIPETKASCEPPVLTRNLCAKAFEVEIKRPLECLELIGLTEEWRQGAPEPHDFGSNQTVCWRPENGGALDKG